MITTFAGLVMILGSYMTFKGRIFEASLIYQVPNSIFMYLGIKNGDYLGATLVFIGVSFALATIYKMHTGVLKKGI